MVKELEDAPRDEIAVLLDADASVVAGESFDVQVRAAGSMLRAHAARGRRAVLALNSASRPSARVSSLDGDWLAAIARSPRSSRTGAARGGAARARERPGRAGAGGRRDRAARAALATKLVQRALTGHGVSSSGSTRRASPAGRRRPNRSCCGCWRRALPSPLSGAATTSPRVLGASLREERRMLGPRRLRRSRRRCSRRLATPRGAAGPAPTPSALACSRSHRRSCRHSGCASADGPGRARRRLARVRRRPNDGGEGFFRPWGAVRRRLLRLLRHAVPFVPSRCRPCTASCCSHLRLLPRPRVRDRARPFPAVLGCWPARRGRRPCSRQDGVAFGAIVLAAALGSSPGSATERPTPALATGVVVVLLGAAAATSSAVAKDAVLDWQQWQPTTVRRAGVRALRLGRELRGHRLPGGEDDRAAHPRPGAALLACDDARPLHGRPLDPGSLRRAAGRPRARCPTTRCCPVLAEEAQL